MKERDYIIATNLAKARMAKEIIRDMHPIVVQEAKDRDALLRMLSDWIAKLELRV